MVLHLFMQTPYELETNVLMWINLKVIILSLKNSKLYNITTHKFENPKNNIVYRWMHVE